MARGTTAVKERPKASASPKRALPERDDVLLTRKEVAEILGVTERWVDRASGRGDFPHVKVGTQNRWRRPDIDAYILRQTRVGRG
jgi:excisionase family DNA binding protein